MAAIEVDIKDTVYRPIGEVFDAILDPEKITCYFVSAASGPLKSGETINWEWADYGVNLDIEVRRVEENKLIEFEWDAGGKRAVVSISLESDREDQCTIRIVEGPFELSEAEMAMALEQTQGWTDFICSLKAYLYTGINLRNGE